MSVAIKNPLGIYSGITDKVLKRPNDLNSELPVYPLLNEDITISYEILDGNLVVDYNEATPRWFKPVVESLVELLRLEPNWDSYGALPINWQLANAAQELLFKIMEDDTPVPIVGPTNRGGIQIEWHERGIDLEIETISTRSFRVSFEDSQTNEEWDCELNVDISPLIQCIRVLSKR